MPKFPIPASVSASVNAPASPEATGEPLAPASGAKATGSEDQVTAGRGRRGSVSYLEDFVYMTLGMVCGLACRVLHRDRGWGPSCTDVFCICPCMSISTAQVQSKLEEDGRAEPKDWNDFPLKISTRKRGPKRFLGSRYIPCVSSSRTIAVLC